MLKVKLIDAMSISELENSINDFLVSVKTEDVQNIKYELGEPYVAIIEYEETPAWCSCMCGDCQYWDDGGDSSGVIGLCHECGGRKRFNGKACEHFKDVRWR